MRPGGAWTDPPRARGGVRFDTHGKTPFCGKIGAASLALAALWALATVETAAAQTIHFDDLDLDGFIPADLQALAGVEVVGTPDCGAPADDPPPRTPEWDRRDKANRFCAMQGELDFKRNPTIAETNERVQAARAAVDPAGEAGPYGGDPFREPLTRWNGLRGRYDSIRYEGPNGEVRHAALFRPLEACVAPDGPCPEGLPRSAGPPYPGLLLVCHICSSTSPEAADSWIWAAETLAEAGYMVLTAPLPADLALDFFVAMPDQPTSRGEVNPLWEELDRNRIGLMGHSGAGSISLSLGQMDARVAAVVSWDRSRSFDPLPLEITTPTLLMTGDVNYFFLDEDFQPVREPLDPPAPGTKWADLELFREAQVPAMLVALRAATHGEVLRLGPTCLVCGRYGLRVNAYYTLAWFDRYLKGRGDPRMARDALARLTAATFDDSADVHAIDMGRFEPGVGNVPATIEGMRAADRLSFYRRSGYWLGRSRALQCEDLRAGLLSGRCGSPGANEARCVRALARRPGGGGGVARSRIRVSCPRIVSGTAAAP